MVRVISAVLEGVIDIYSPQVFIDGFSVQYIPLAAPRALIALAAVNKKLRTVNIYNAFQNCVIAFTILYYFSFCFYSGVSLKNNYYLC